MPGIKVSPKLRNKLPPEQRENLEEVLWDHSGGQCFLCGGPLNRASDEIQVDHDEPDAEEGATTIENLNLAHKACNSAKRNSPTINIKPYLQLAAFIKKHDGLVRYAECTEHFKISPRPVVVAPVKGKSEVSIELPDGTIARCPVFQSKNAEGTFDYCYVSVPRNALFNDDDCQPRNIKLPQAWAIYVDLQRNPLHEPPGCRLVTDGGVTRMVMFDGQHKTVASWMADYKSIVVKLYLNITLAQTIGLVNSVQAKIKKLPLSPFEMAAKMSDEWQIQLSAYESAVGAESMSEQGFIGWLKATDRARGKQAFQEASLQQLLSRDELHFLKYVKHAGTTGSDDALIPEATFKNKVLKPLIHTAPLSAMGGDGQALRAREAENVVEILNYFTGRVFEPAGDGVPLSDAQLEVRRRFSYQTALRFVAEMIPKIVGSICLKEPDVALLEAKISDDQWKSILAAIDRLVAHPIWHKGFNIGPKAQAVENSLLKNQGTKEALAAAGLTYGYIMGGDNLRSDWYR